MDCGIRIPRKQIIMVAAATAVATIAVSCSNKLKADFNEDLSDAPKQIVIDMKAVQTENGRMQMRMNAKRMEIYE